MTVAVATGRCASKSPTRSASPGSCSAKPPRRIRPGIAASHAFAEHAAPGLIDLLLSRADDLSGELTVEPVSRFGDLLKSRAVDVTLGPAVREPGPAIVVRPFLNYQIIAVTSPSNPLAAATPTIAQLRAQSWMLGPSAGGIDGDVAAMLRRLEIPEAAQRIFQSDSAAQEEVQRIGGVTLSIGFAVAKDLAGGRLAQVKGPGLQVGGEWFATTLPASARQPAVSELLRFITTPRCTQAMIRGSGVGVSRFRPKVHVTLWS